MRITAPSLDDPNQLERYDSLGMLGTIEAFPEQCAHAVEIGREFDPPSHYRFPYSNIVCAGIGGSAIAFDVLRCYLAQELRMPFFVNRNYILPSYVDRRTLVIITSYSGNTEEMISAYRDARKKKARILVVTSGGILRKLADKDRVSVIQVPAGMQPRCATGYLFFPVLIFLAKVGAVRSKAADISDTIKALDGIRRCEAGRRVPAKNNIAKNIAKLLNRRFPVIYASQDYLECAAARWRGELAENAKTLSSVNCLPEMNHNEIAGWKNPKKVLRDFVVVALNDELDHPRIIKRMGITEKILVKEGVQVVRVPSFGSSKLARIFSLLYIADFVSFYLAVLIGVDPSPIDHITYLKKALKK
jgi:glucose/mannose-6-phosphate isomerase